MKKLILLLTFIVIGFVTTQAQKGLMIDPLVCGPATVHEADLGLTAMGFSNNGCTVIHAREVSNFQWYVYGVQLTGMVGNAPSLISPDVCGPVTFAQAQVGLRVKGIAEDQGCTEIHVREVSANVWTAYGVRLTLF